MDTLPLAFLGNSSFGLLDLSTEQLFWVRNEESLIEELNRRIAVDKEFDYFYINNMLYIEINNNRIVFFDYEKGDNYLLVKNLSLPNFVYIQDNIELIRETIDK